MTSKTAIVRQELYIEIQVNARQELRLLYSQKGQWLKDFHLLNCKHFCKLPADIGKPT